MHQQQCAQCHSVPCSAALVPACNPPFPCSTDPGPGRWPSGLSFSSLHKWLSAHCILPAACFSTMNSLPGCQGHSVPHCMENGHCCFCWGLPLLSATPSKTIYLLEGHRPTFSSLSSRAVEDALPSNAATARLCHCGHPQLMLPPLVPRPHPGSCSANIMASLSYQLFCREPHRQTHYLRVLTL